MTQESRDFYKQVIQPTRRKGTRQVGRDLTFEMLSDKGRIITSAAFRRLQTKAQVFSLEQNAAVRSRLTHTMEVAFIGELLAALTFKELESQKLINEDLRLPFSLTVQNACFLHDVGNPPFGHLGEAAIGHWFSDARNRRLLLKAWDKVPNKEAHYRAFTDFDGNPQMLRIVTCLQFLDNEFGLNLSYTLLASLLKYLSSERNPESEFHKKIGFFETEKEVVTDTWKVLQLKTTEDGTPAQRHPLTFLMEAADDIAYCSSDIEDALEKGVTTEKVFFDELLNGQELENGAKPRDVISALSDGMKKIVGDAENYDDYRKRYERSEEHQRESPNALFVRFKVELTNQLVFLAVNEYINCHDAILDGSRNMALIDAQPALEFVKRFAQQNIFCSEEAVNVEMSGYHILQGILDSLRDLLLCDTESFRSLKGNKKFPLEDRLFSLLSRKHLCFYDFAVKKHPDLEPVLRTHLIVDYVAGMTDSHAVKTFNMLKGITG